MESDEPKPFGGKWSDIKLATLQKYLCAYTTALKNQPFNLGYIDAFAGAGEHDIGNMEAEQMSLITETNMSDEKFRHGSPFIALKTNPPFDGFIFIDQNEESINRLREQIVESKLHFKNIKYVVGDANAEIQRICNRDWSQRRAVAFLDPFATQVNWETIERIAKTKAIDMWLLFPAMAINRMLTRSGEISEAWTAKLNLCFGTNNWKEAFYDTRIEATLFGDEMKTSKVSEIFDKLGRFVIQRLDQVFAGVYTKPIVLKNSSNTPIFLLCFACGNEQGAKTALRIAGHIIEKTS